LTGDPLIEGVRWVYEQTVAQAEKRLKPHCGLILTGHCYMQGGELSQLSERRIFGGGEHALPVDLFSETIDYVALGHLHKGQKVGGREWVRYSGSPLPLSVTERDYKHGVRLITLNQKGEVASQESIPVPRTVPYLRVPQRGALSVEQALIALGELPLPADDPGLDMRPFLEVVVELTGPEPGLRNLIDRALEGVPVRLAGIQVMRAGNQKALADSTEAHSLEELKPEDVFCQIHQKRYNCPPQESLSRAFGEILEQVQNPSGADT
jgi:DNA repair protein SbcD/Mre11